jgi:hypothetical protein
MAKKVRVRHQRRIPGISRVTRGSGLHPDAQEKFDALARQRGVSKAWLGAYMIEVFLFGEGNTYAEDPAESDHRRRKKAS